MSKPLTEQKVLKKLGIEDFRYLTKDKVITMASMLDKMDPDVAKKALEQFPEFSSAAKDVLNEYKAVLDEGLKANKESVQSYYDSCDSIIKSLQKQLDKKRLSGEERKHIIDKMIEVSQMMGVKDSENKKFLTAIATMAMVATGVVLTTLVAAIGGKTKIGKD